MESSSTISFRIGGDFWTLFFSVIHCFAVPGVTAYAEQLLLQRGSIQKRPSGDHSQRPRK